MGFLDFMMVKRNTKLQHSPDGQQVGIFLRQTNSLAPKNYKKVLSNENGRKSRTDVVLMISPFGAAK